LAFNPKDRWTIEQLAESKFMKTPIDEEAAMKDIRERF